MEIGDFQLINCCKLPKVIAELSNLSHTFCSTYLIAVEKLFDDIKNAQNIQEKRDLFNIFTNKFTAVPDIWLTWRNIEKELLIADNQLFLQCKKIFKNLKIKAQKDFQFGYDFDTEAIFEFIYDISRKKSCLINNAHFEVFKHVKELNHICESYLDINHILNRSTIFQRQKLKNKDFSDYWDRCELFSTMKIPKKTKIKVEKYLLVADYLVGIKDDLKWMKKLVKHGKSKECIIEFIENRIYNNPFNANLWNLYICYLEKEEQNIKILNVYSRYCRLFTDDFSMRNKYFERTIELYHRNDSVSKWILDIVKIEADFVSQNSSINLMIKILAEINPGSEIGLPLNLSFDEIFAIFKQKIEHRFSDFNFEKKEEIPETFLHQNFSFPVTVIRNILTGADSSKIQKLQKCCKYFLSKIKVTVIHKLSFTIIKQMFMYQNSIFINNRNLDEFKMEKIWLTNSLIIDMIPVWNSTMNFTKTLFPKIYKCDIRFLRLSWQSLTGLEFDYLTKSERIESLDLNSTPIKDSEGKEYCLEKIIQLCPNGHSFRISETPCNSNTTKILSSLNHKSKIKNFRYSYATAEFDIDEFSNFVMKNGTDSSDLSVKFFPNLQHKYVIFYWISSETMPQISELFY